MLLQIIMRERNSLKNVGIYYLTDEKQLWSKFIARVIATAITQLCILLYAYNYVCIILIIYIAYDPKLDKKKIFIGIFLHCLGSIEILTDHVVLL